MIRLVLILEIALYCMLLSTLLLLSIPTIHVISRAMKTNPKDFRALIAKTVFLSHAGIVAPKVFIVGEDIDPTDIKQLVWALSTRITPGVSEYIYNDVPNFPLNPFMSQGNVENPRWGHKVVYNALFPGEFFKPQYWTVSNFEGEYPEDVQEKIVKNWGKYSFKD